MAPILNNTYKNIAIESLNRIIGSNDISGSAVLLSDEKKGLIAGGNRYKVQAEVLARKTLYCLSLGCAEGSRNLRYRRRMGREHVYAAIAVVYGMTVADEAFASARVGHDQITRDQARMAVKAAVENGGKNYEPKIDAPVHNRFNQGSRNNFERIKRFTLEDAPASEMLVAENMQMSVSLLQYGCIDRLIHCYRPDLTDLLQATYWGFADKGLKALEKALDGRVEISERTHLMKNVKQKAYATLEESREIIEKADAIYRVRTLYEAAGNAALAA